MLDVQKLVVVMLEKVYMIIVAPVICATLMVIPA
jgi:hypothetical protein